MRVWTDGSRIGSGAGGWAWVAEDDRSAFGCARDTTNQRMELQAALEAVRAISGPLTIVSDSAYVVNCFVEGWWQAWERKGWLTAAKKPVANRDLWEPLVALVRERGDVEFEWVKGHAGDPGNEAADQLATTAAAQQVNSDVPPIPDAVLARYPSDDWVGPPPTDLGQSLQYATNLRRMKEGLVPFPGPRPNYDPRVGPQRPFRRLCPEADERDALDDGEFWERVASNLGVNTDPEDLEVDLVVDPTMALGTCVECGSVGACGYDSEGRAMIHVAYDEEQSA